MSSLPELLTWKRIVRDLDALEFAMHELTADKSNVGQYLKTQLLGGIAEASEIAQHFAEDEKAVADAAFAQAGVARIGEADEEEEAGNGQPG